MSIVLFKRNEVELRARILVHLCTCTPSNKIITYYWWTI